MGLPLHCILLALSTLPLPSPHPTDRIHLFLGHSCGRFYPKPADSCNMQKRAGVWDHWIVFNILPTTKEIYEGKNPAGLLGKNTNGKNAYGGPCPPDREHRYFFKLYALDKMLDLSAGVSKKKVEEAMPGHIIAQGELVGRYQRP